MSDKSDDVMDRSRAWLTGIGLGALGIAALVIAFVIGTNYSDEATPVTGVEKAKEKPAELPKAAGPGKDLFVSTCGSCHALSEAGTSGAVGPDLDALKPDDALVVSAIENGGSGAGGMPPGLLKGKEADDVAKYVSTVAGSGG